MLSVGTEINDNVCFVWAEACSGFIWSMFRKVNCPTITFVPCIQIRTGRREGKGKEWKKMKGVGSSSAQEVCGSSNQGHISLGIYDNQSSVALTLLLQLSVSRYRTNSAAECTCSDAVAVAIASIW